VFQGRTQSGFTFMASFLYLKSMTQIIPMFCRFFEAICSEEAFLTSVSVYHFHLRLISFCFVVLVPFGGSIYWFRFLNPSIGPV
jgi:hypothetical protein